MRVEVSLERDIDLVSRERYPKSISPYACWNQYAYEQDGTNTYYIIRNGMLEPIPADMHDGTNISIRMLEPICL